MTEPSLPEESIFARALEIGSPAERGAFLDRACGDNAALRAEVEALLGAHGRSGDLLDLPSTTAWVTGGDRPTGDDKSAATGDEPVTERPGTVIGPYKLLQQIGEGGMGTVFMAEQAEPVQRKVALKIIKAGLDSREVIARFEQERQALAMMDHPNIAKVLDAGTTDAGRPYFVMELVKGIRITKYCDQQHLTPQERLELFIPVCQAVQHAHQKGIIHRDLKPSNVLIALYDGKPIPKVIDFGVAKATAHKLTERTLFTEVGQIVGTLEYMAPEQAELNNLDIDTRADIYSLGALLYQLLTGTPPFTAQQLRSVAFTEMLRLIREVEPPKPSTKLSSSPELPSIAANRKLEPKKLTKLVKGELDWIVMKCLEKDRNRRYETANGLARDIERYLHDDPVQACPPSALYRFRKFARRNKAGLTVAGLLLVFIVSLGVGVGWVVRDWAARRTETAREANAALDEAANQQQEGRMPEALVAARRAAWLVDTGAADETLRQRVQARRADLEMIAELEDARLQASGVKEGHFDLELGIRLYAEAFGRAGLDIEALPAEEAGERIRESSVAAEVAAVLQHWALTRQTIRGRSDPSWRHLLRVARAADPDEWRDRVRDAFERGDRQALVDLAGSEGALRQSPVTLNFLALALRFKEGVEPAEALLRQARQRHPGDFWANHELAWVLQSARPPRWDEAICFYAAAVALRPQSPGARYNLGSAFLNLGKLAEAIAEYQEAIRLKKDYPEAHDGLGMALAAKGRLDEAIAEYQEAIRLKKDDSDAHNDLGVALKEKGRLDEAIAEYQEALRLKKDYPEAHSNLGNAFMEKGRLDEAIAEHQEALRLKKDYPEAHTNLGNAFMEKGRLDEAIAKYQVAIRLKKDLPQAHYNLGNAFMEKGRLDEAIAEYQEVLRLKKDPEAHYNLGNAFRKKGWLDKAIAEYQEAIRLKEDYPEAHCNLGSALQEKGRLDEAIAEYQEALRIKKDLPEAHDGLGLALLKKGRLDEAIAEFQEALRIKKDNPETHYNLGNAFWKKGWLDRAIAEYQEAIRLKEDYPEAHCNLGHALQQQGRFAEALAAMKRGHDLGSKDPRWPYPSAQWVRAAEQLVAVEDKLQKVLKGEAQPADAGEQMALALLCRRHKKLYAAATRFFADAFDLDAKLADDMERQHRYRAACAAALAGCGQGNDADKLDEKDVVRLRKLALGWLRADLAYWRKQVDSAKPDGRARAQQTLKYWQADADLAGVRGKESLGKLPEAERQEWEKLWAEVEALR